MEKANSVVIMETHFENWPNGNPFSIQQVIERSQTSLKVERKNAECYEIIYIFEGEITVISGGIHRTAHSGDTVLLTKNTHHHYFSKNAVHTISVNFCGELAESIINSLGVFHDPIKRLKNSGEALRDIVYYCRKQPEIKPRIAYSLGKITGILYSLYQLEITIPEKGIHQYAGQTTPEFIKVVIDRHLDRFYTNEELAEYMKCSVSTMVRSFKRRFGVTPLNYQTSAKIAEIKQKLRDGSCSVKEISSQLGFCSPTYLTTFFEKHTGLTPRQYRENINTVLQ